MPMKIQRFVMERLLAGGGDEAHDDDGHHSEFGVHIQYEDLYNAILFLACIYVSGQIASRLLKMPNLVGEIVAGILLGPPLADFVPNPEAWVMLGEIGLVLLVIEAGIDIDLDMLKLIGTRGFVIAFLGSIMPIGIGVVLALALGADTISAIACGASFGPTSLGIALNILRSGGILNTPVGQLIVSAAVIDDMIALVVLSQLEALTGEITVTGVLIPVISALCFLIIGGYVAIYILPGLIHRFILDKIDESLHDRVELGILLVMVLVLMPATYYAKASYLMGSFVAGLTFCSSHGLHHIFVQQYKRLLQWLMRIFFAASIGFQVPVKNFGSLTVLWQGLFLTLALVGKLAAGFLVPNFTQASRYRGLHLRDSLITGFSLAAEGEFAFVIAVFAVDNGLIPVDLYSSIVLAVLLSTIVPPFLLRYTINRWNRLSEEAVKKAAEIEANRRHDLESQTDPLDKNQQLESEILNQTAVFLCIQTQSESAWGLMHNLMSGMQDLGLDVIDHRSWHPRGVNTTLVNEIYVKDFIPTDRKDVQETLKERMEEIQNSLSKTINQEGSNVKVQRWFPGVVQEITEEVQEDTKKRSSVCVNIESRLLEEAQTALENKRQMQMAATQERSLTDLVKETQLPEASIGPLAPTQAKPGRNRRRRQKMRSTPVMGGGLFGEATRNENTVFDATKKASDKRTSTLRESSQDHIFSALNKRTAGYAAELTVDGETYKIRINDDTLKGLQKGYSGQMLDSRGVSTGGGLTIQAADQPIVNMLAGYVRNHDSMEKITEEKDEDLESEHMSVFSNEGGTHKD